MNLISLARPLQITLQVPRPNKPEEQERDQIERIENKHVGEYPSNS
jgi:hypothetical protein